MFYFWNNKKYILMSSKIEKRLKSYNKDNNSD